MVRTILGALLFQLPTSVLAVQLNVLEEQVLGGTIIADIRIRDVLHEDPVPRLRIYPGKVRQHRHLVDILAAGFPFDQESFRNVVAEVLADYPSVCKANLSVSLAVAPISGIDRFVPGVKDKRRVVGIYIGGCLQEDLPACEYDQQDSGEVEFNARSLLSILSTCGKAMNNATSQGAALIQGKSPAKMSTVQQNP